MIQDGFMYVSVLVALAAVMVFIEKKFGKTKFMKFIPGIVLIYIGAALMQTFGLFESNESTEAAYSNHCSVCVTIACCCSITEIVAVPSPFCAPYIPNCA